MPLPFKTQRRLRVPVDRERRAVLADEAAEINKRLDKLRADEIGLKDRLKTVRADMESEIEKISAKLRIVADGDEEVAVDCEWREHADRPFKMLVRLDTAEVIEEKPLDPDEMQRAIPGTEATTEAEDDDGEEEQAEEVARPAVETRAKKGGIYCPRVLSEAVADDPRQDTLCGKDGAARRKGFCEECYEQLGGKNGSPQMTHDLARRTRRGFLVQQAAEEEAARLEQAEAQGSA